MGIKQILIWALVLTIFIEGLTIFMRFGLGLQSTRDTASTIGRLTGGIRIHHGYIGVAIAAAALLFFSRMGLVQDWIMVAGLSLISSDLIHHFIVLWAITGSSEFHLIYPGS